MSGHKITGIHAIGVEIPKGMSFKELMEQLLEGGEAELEKELDEEMRQPETGKCDCPVCDPDKDTVEERLFHPVDQWQHAVDVASDVHDAAGSLEHALFELGENQLAFEASMILSQSLTLLRAINASARRLRNEHRSIAQKEAYAPTPAEVNGRAEIGRAAGSHVR